MYVLIKGAFVINNAKKEYVSIISAKKEKVVIQSMKLTVFKEISKI
jgi:hypothetical protein